MVNVVNNQWVNIGLEWLRSNNNGMVGNGLYLLGLNHVYIGWFTHELFG